MKTNKKGTMGEVFVAKLRKSFMNRWFRSGSDLVPIWFRYRTVLGATGTDEMLYVYVPELVRYLPAHS